VSEQVDRVVALVRDVLGPDLVGAYLHGSSVLGGPGAHSDIDVLVVSRRPTTRDQKRRLVEAMLELSIHPGRPEAGRPLELTIAVHSDLRPWRFPPRRDFQYGDWWRTEFEAGELEPWQSQDDPDLAILITIALRGDAPLAGPPPADVFDPVPAADLERAMLHSIDDFFAKFDTDTSNTLLVLARVWTTLATGEIRRKDAAAERALARLAEEHRPPLAKARGRFLGEDDDVWGGEALGQARSCADAMVVEIERARAGGRLRP
jgi:predicted nucleotidyltransferase